MTQLVSVSRFIVKWNKHLVFLRNSYFIQSCGTSFTQLSVMNLTLQDWKNGILRWVTLKLQIQKTFFSFLTHLSDQERANV
jgi:hypothetical protein